MADPITQIFLQAQAPTGKSNTGFEAFMQGRELSLRERRVQMEEELMPLRMEAERLSQRATGLDIDLKMLLKQREIDLKTARTEAAKIMLDAARDPNGWLSPDLENRVNDVIRRVPALVTDEIVGQPMLNNYRAAKQWDALNQRAKAMGLSPSKATIDPKTGQLLPTFEDPTQQSTPDNLTNLQRRRDALIAAGAPKQQIEEVNNRIRMLTTRSNEIIETLPGGGFRITRGSGDGMTTATQTRAEESLSGALRTVDIANRLEPLLTEETVGVKAAIGGLFKDRILAQWYPELASQERAESTVLAARLKSSTINELKSDSNITEKERAELMKAVPEIENPLDSPERAKQVVRASRKLAALHALIRGQQLGQPPAFAAVQVLEDTDLRDAAKSGLISSETAISSYRLRRQGQQPTPAPTGIP